MSEIGKFMSSDGSDPREVEVPQFIIERHNEVINFDDSDIPTDLAVVSRRNVWLHRMSWLFVLCAVAALSLWCFSLWNYYYNIGVPVSATPQENIQKLQQPAPAVTAEVVMTSDTILGVGLDIYAIHGLKGSIEFAEPDTADTSVYLYSRSADHGHDGECIGSLVACGVEKQNDLSRLGYMGMADGGMVIGIGRSDKVKNYCQERGGSFFRQFILVSDGQLPPRFFLHGKVERRAIGRIGESLYYVASQDRETMWDFADALREYGFVDAIYITGGADYSFYRSADGVRHDISAPANYPHKKWKGIIPWLVFRADK